MARNAQLRSQGKYSSSRQYAKESSHLGNSDERGQKYSEIKGNMKFTTKQLAMFWAGSFAFILIAFYLGFIAGKREGAISVLDQAGDQMVRLELHTPREPYPKATEIGADGGIELLDGNSTVVSKETAGNTEKAILAEKEPSKIDFTGSALNSNNSQVVVPTKKDTKTVDLKAEKTPKFEEIYRGKDLFAPPPSKVLEAKSEPEIEPVIKVDEPVVEVPKKEELESSAESLRPKPGWYVQIAAATSEKDALDYYNKIVGNGLEGGLEPAAIKDRSFYRVLVGPFADQNIAMGKRQELKQKIGSAGEPFIRQVQ